MGKTMPVLWINSIGMRKPELGRAGDVARISRRLRRLFRRAEHKENKLTVLSPTLIPKAQSGPARCVNRLLINFQLRRELKGLRGPAEYWCFVPTAVDLLPEGKGQRAEGKGQRAEPGAKAQMPDDPLVIYYCVDDWSTYKGLHNAWLVEKEQQMLKRANVVFTPSQYLRDKCAGVAHCDVEYVPHGVDYEKFAAGVDRTGVPDDVVDLPKPVIGFYGNIYPWIDFDLVAQLARARSDWTFTLIGQIYCDVGELELLPNVHLPGRREHDELPRYCRAFDAAIIPYDISNPRMSSVNPAKLKEFLAAGVPVVAAAIPEIEAARDRLANRDDIIMCRTTGEWLAALEKQIAREDRADISRRICGEDWGAKIAEMRAIVEEASSKGMQDD
jgi:glycosyltransferase involved in cell wall biosynthesis